jgi:hypothetical protein
VAFLVDINTTQASSIWTWNTMYIHCDSTYPHHTVERADTIVTREYICANAKHKVIYNVWMVMIELLGLVKLYLCVFKLWMGTIELIDFFV